MASPNTFEEQLKKLPPDAQARVQAWMGTQMFIARELGLSSEAWLGYVEWAFANPLDFSFVGDGAQADALGDSVAAAPADKKAEKLLGVEKTITVSTGEPVDPSKARKAGLSNIHMLGDMLPKDKKR